MQISHTNNNLVFRSQEDSRFEEYHSESKVEDELLLLWRLVVDLVLLSLPPPPRIDLEAVVDGGRRGEGRPAGKGRGRGEGRPAGAVGDGRRGAGVGERGGRSGRGAVGRGARPRCGDGQPYLRERREKGIGETGQIFRAARCRSRVKLWAKPETLGRAGRQRGKSTFGRASRGTLLFSWLLS
jgi:hypothetical protein